MTLVFENRDTVRFQIQEMLRVERIVQPDKVQHELDTYNALLPGRARSPRPCSSRSPIPRASSRSSTASSGLEEPGHLALRIGETAYPALFDPGQSREDRISAVHYIRFRPAKRARGPRFRGDGGSGSDAR